MDGAYLWLERRARGKGGRESEEETTANKLLPLRLLYDDLSAAELASLFIPLQSACVQGRVSHSPTSCDEHVKRPQGDRQSSEQQPRATSLVSRKKSPIAVTLSSHILPASSLTRSCLSLLSACFHVSACV